jgi:hypothetical protein
MPESGQAEPSGQSRRSQLNSRATGNQQKIVLTLMAFMAFSFSKSISVSPIPAALIDLIPPPPMAVKSSS